MRGKGMAWKMKLQLIARAIRDRLHPPLIAAAAASREAKPGCSLDVTGQEW